MSDNVIADLVCTCGKCGKQAEIVCFVDDVPWCEECLSKALGGEAATHE